MTLVRSAAKIAIVKKGFKMLAARLLEVPATFENGVFVPDGKVELHEHQRVTLRISTEIAADDCTADPRPAGGVELVEWRARHRIQIDPEIAREIAENPEFDIENS